MPKLDLTRLIAAKGLGAGEIAALKGPGFSWVKPAPAPDPEEGLTLTTSIPVGDLVSIGTNLGANTNAVFAMDVTGLDGSSGGVIFECGGSGSGGYVGFRSNGTFVCRGGSGVDSATSTVAAVIIPAGSAPSGDGTLVWEYSGVGSAVAVRCWWNGTLLGSHTSTHTGGWTGSDSGGYFRWSAALSGNGYSAFLVNEYYDSDADYTTASALRYYANQASAL